MSEIIRIFRECEVWIEKSVPRDHCLASLGTALWCQTVTLGQIFLSAPNNQDRFFFLHTFWSPVSDINVGVAINEWHSYMLTSAILNVDVVCDVAMASTPNVLMTELRDLLYNQSIDDRCCYSFFIHPTGRIRVCKVRFIRTGENRGKPCLVCKRKGILALFGLWSVYVCTSATIIIDTLSFYQHFKSYLNPIADNEAIKYVYVWTKAYPEITVWKS